MYQLSWWEQPANNWSKKILQTQIGIESTALQTET